MRHRPCVCPACVPHCRCAFSVRAMQVILAGSFAFHIIDRLDAGTVGVEAPEWLYDSVYEHVINVPLLWCARRRRRRRRARASQLCDAVPRRARARARASHPCVTRCHGCARAGLR